MYLTSSTYGRRRAAATGSSALSSAAAVITHQAHPHNATSERFGRAKLPGTTIHHEHRPPQNSARGWPKPILKALYHKIESRLAPTARTTDSGQRAIPKPTNIQRFLVRERKWNLLVSTIRKRALGTTILSPPPYRRKAPVVSHAKARPHASAHQRSPHPVGALPRYSRGVGISPSVAVPPACWRW